MKNEAAKARGETPSKAINSIWWAYCTRFEPETKRLAKNRMTVDEYLAHEPEAEKSDFKQVSSILDSEAEEVWSRVWWRLLNEQFLGWYIWLKDNFMMVKEFVDILLHHSNQSHLQVKDSENFP